MAKKFKCCCCGAIRIVNKTSGYIGVDYYKTTNKWRARVTDNDGKNHHLGYYDSEEQASLIYDNFILTNKILNRPLNHFKG